MKAGKAKLSIRQFSDYSNDLCYSDMDNFDDRLARLLSFIKTDPLLMEVHSQLINNPNVDYDSWYKAIKDTEKGMRGSGTLTFPIDKDERLSLMYQVLIKMGNKEIEPLNFSLPFCTTSSPKLYVFLDFFNENVTRPLMREITYKLEDIELELPNDDKKEVPPAVFQIIQNAGNVINQSIFGDGNNQTASLVVPDGELDKLFIDLKTEIEKLKITPEDKRDSLETVESCKELITSEKPKVSAAKKLLNTLLPLGANVSTIVALLITLL